MEEFKNRMRALRTSLGLTQKEFAARIGLKQNTIATYEMGRNMPADSVMELICREYNVDRQWLLTGEGTMFAGETPKKVDPIGDLMSALKLDDEVRPLVETLVSMDATERKIVMSVLQRALDGYNAVMDSKRTASDYEAAYEKQFGPPPRRRSRSSGTDSSGGPVADRETA